MKLREKNLKFWKNAKRSSYVTFRASRANVFLISCIYLIAPNLNRAWRKANFIMQTPREKIKTVTKVQILIGSSVFNALQFCLALKLSNAIKT